MIATDDGREGKLNLKIRGSKKTETHETET